MKLSREESIKLLTPKSGLSSMRWGYVEQIIMTKRIVISGSISILLIVLVGMLRDKPYGDIAMLVGAVAGAITAIAGTVAGIATAGKASQAGKESEGGQK